MGAVKAVSEEAHSIEEAKLYKADKLSLIRRELRSIPHEVRSLRNLTIFDFSENPAERIEEDVLPPKLEELRLTGCLLNPSLPSSIADLPKLQRLYCGANRLENVEAVFQCCALKHAGLSFNNISFLPVHLFAPLRNLISLDLAHNSLPLSAVDQLKELPNLAAVSLAGNPMCLMPQYQQHLKATLKTLQFLDGQKTDSLVGSRGTSRGTSRGQSVTNPPSSNAAIDTCMEVELTSMIILEDPFVWLKELWAKQEAEAVAVAAEAAAAAAAEAAEKAAAGGKSGGKQVAAAVAAAAAAAKPAAETVAMAPPQPVIYHVEFTDADGTSYASMPVVVQPPEAPMSEEQLAAKAKAEKGKKPAPPPKTPPKAGKGAPPPEEPKPTVEPGSLKVQIGIAANVTWRDWIRSGLKVRVYRTRMEAVRKPKPIEEEEAESVVKTPEKGKKPEKKAKPAAAEPDVVDMAMYDIVHGPTELLGIGSLKTSDLVNGSMYNCGDSVPIVPKPALFDGKGIRMALEDERHPTQPKASLKSKMRLHVVPKSFGVDEEVAEPIPA